MNVAKLKVGQKVAVTALITLQDKHDLTVGMVGEVRRINELGAWVSFPCDGVNSRYMSARQIRKYKEPKHLSLKRLL